MRKLLSLTTSDPCDYGIFDSWISLICENYQLLSSQSCPLNNLENIFKLIVSLAAERPALGVVNSSSQNKQKNAYFSSVCRWEIKETEF